MNYTFISKTKIFQGLSEKETEDVLVCMQANTKTYRKGEMIYRSGSIVDSIGLVLSGSVNIEQNDAWGNVSILDNIGRGRVFAEAYVCAEKEVLTIDVVAAEQSEILFLNLDKVISICGNTCPFHVKLVRNMLSVMAFKNLNLSRKISHTTPKSIRGKLLSYLSYQAMSQGKFQFEIPFNRQQLADYLCVDRSAMSNELSKMQKEGLLSYNKNSFCLKETFED
ncbi:Crp/Fnr family transcriptional regulator [Novisyntrophococcus fermenticellae]|uniref:Crp/Fnr family transcriptional regulator n=1 Tax=Novisyntrophococcus fermenticellae TaxID=2068655 RepID=UPI001E462F90|nr:Crp/Fnr family transcriptional regulator [Novisyntrophococcus fermenticellae]